MTIQRKQITPENFLPRKIDKSSIRLNNLVATRTRHITTELLGTDQELTIQLTPFIKHEKSCFVVLYLKLWGELTRLRLSAWPLSKKLQELVTDKELLELPKDLAIITLSVAFEPLLQTISNTLDSNIEIINYSLNDMGRDSNTCSNINFTFKTTGEPEIQASLTIPDNIQDNLVNIIKTIPVASGLRFQQIPVPIYCECGRSTITHNILYSIEPGDVLLMDSYHNKDLGSLKIRLTTGKIFLAEKNNDSDTYELIEEENKMSNNEHEENISLNDIPINVHFDIGKQSLNLEEMEKIGIGYTFELEKSLPELVTLRIANKTIGFGEIVTIGDRTGVRITQINQD